MSSFYVREEDGTSHFVLEDDSGDLLLEELENNARVTQEVVEVVIEAVGQGRVTQESVEVVVAGDSQARVTQVVVEGLIRRTKEDVWVAIID